MYARSVASWGLVEGKEQTRFQAIARQHSHENSFCFSVQAQVAQGRPVSAKQAGLLMKIATERGWSIPAV